jgi:uncharacterized protein
MCLHFMLFGLSSRESQDASREAHMTESAMPWRELVQYSEDHNLLAKRLYVVFSEPTSGIGPIMESLDPHVEYQTRLELDGTMFAAGPLATDDEQSWAGEGMFVYRADSMAQAGTYAEADPMHQSGARTFRVRPWLLNEGTFSVRLYYSGGPPRID